MPSVTITPTKLISSSSFRLDIAYFDDNGNPLDSSNVINISVSRTTNQIFQPPAVDTIYAATGGPTLIFDFGDGFRSATDQTISAPFQPNGGQTYSYSITAYFSTGPVTATSDAVTLSGASLNIIPDGLNSVFQQALSAAIKTAPWQIGVEISAVPSVYNDMPISGFPALPMVSINEAIIQQRNVPIGQQAIVPDANNNIVISAYAKRQWRISVFSANSTERDTLRDFIMGALHCILTDIFVPLGNDVNHDFIVTSSSSPGIGQSPGFYLSEILFTVAGTYNTTIQSYYTTISSISGAVQVQTYADSTDTVELDIQVPP